MKLICTLFLIAVAAQAQWRPCGQRAECFVAVAQSERLYIPASPMSPARIATVSVSIEDEQLTQQERWATIVGLHALEPVLFDKAPMSLDLEMAPIPSVPVYVAQDGEQLIDIPHVKMHDSNGQEQIVWPKLVSADAPLPVHTAAWQQPPSPTKPYSFEVRFSQITAISLGKHKNAVLVNARACNTDASRAVVLPQEQLLMATTDLQMLTPTQATWLLTQKQGKAFATQFERFGTLGLGLAAGYAAVPMIGAGILVVQQLVDFFRSQEPNIAPFLAEMLPLEIPLNAAGTKGDCATGSMFAAKKGNKL